MKNDMMSAGNLFDIDELIKNSKINLLISSPAGSGKTQKLMERYVAILHQQYEEKKKIEPERIVAITFTEKAAAEMKGRILLSLRNYPEIYNLFITKLNKVRISTMHSFFFSLYRRFAIEAGENPHVEVMDENQQKEIIDNMYRRLMFGKIELPEKIKEPLTFLLSAFGWNRVRELIQKMFSMRTKLYRIKEVIENNDNNYLYPESKSKLFDFKQFLKDYNKLVSESSSKAMRETKKLYAKNINEFGVKIFTILDSVYEDIKKDLGKIDYDDMEIKLLKLLRDEIINYNLLYDFDLHFDYLLVDEFQDTNYIQWEIIEKLIEEWLAGKGAKEESGKIPSVFFVGDPKQSIYFFRGANVEVMNIVNNLFQERKKIPECCDRYENVSERRNFRSRHNIVEFVNRVFSKIMGKDEMDALWKTKYEYFECQRDREDLGEVGFIIYRGENNITAAQSANAEANMIAKKILELHKAGYAFSDIAILLRARTHLNRFENVFLNKNIPFRVYHGQGFFKEKEIQLLLSLMRFLYNPDDDISLFTILRSPFYGLKDDELIKISHFKEDEDNRLSMFERLKKCNNSIYEDLIRYIDDYKRLHSYIVLNRFLMDKGRYYYFSEKQRYANVLKLFNLLEEMEYRLEDKLEIDKKLRYMEDRGDLEKATILDENYNAVTLMTIHSAKGLEYPCVFVVQIANPEKSRVNSIVACEEAVAKIPLRVKIDFTLFPEPNEDKIVKEYSGRNMEEYKRLFYVACTRAREKLFLTGVVGNKIKKDSWLGLLERNQLISFVDNRLQWSDELSSIIKVDEYSEIPFIKPYIPEKAKVKTFYDYPVKEQVNVLYMQPSRLISDKFEKMSLDLYLKEVGEIIHMVMEKYTKGLIASSELEPESLRLFKYQHDSPIKSILINCIKLIEQSEVIEIAAPGQNKFAEIPFVYREGNSYWKGRADLVEVSEDKLIIYDYKVHKLDSAELKNMYYPQLELYAKALSKIWKNRDIHMRIVHINPLSGVKILEVGRINKREDFL